MQYNILFMGERLYKAIVLIGIAITTSNEGLRVLDALRLTNEECHESVKYCSQELNQSSIIDERYLAMNKLVEYLILALFDPERIGLFLVG
jgi:hypothetical protein